MNLKIKICGMRDAQNMQDIASLQPDYMGFIFYAKSPRNANGYLTTGLPPFGGYPKTVGVFVDEDLSIVLDVLHQYQLDYAQLHGQESVTYCQSIRDAGFGVFKVFPIDASTSFEAMKEYEAVADYYLFDTKSPKHGGTGQKFDWGLLDRYEGTVPVILSGGIGPEDIAQVIDIAKRYPWIAGLDLNSKFELSPGLKNVEQLRTFLDALRAGQIILEH